MTYTTSSAVATVVVRAVLDALAAAEWRATITTEYAVRLSPTEFIRLDRRDDAAAYVDRARAAGYDATLVTRATIRTEWTEVQT